MPTESTPPGPPGPAEPSKKTKEEIPDEETFKEHMKVKETDTEKKKKRKKYQFEEEEEFSPIIPKKEKKVTKESKLELPLSPSFQEETDEKEKNKMLEALQKELEKDIGKEKIPEGIKLVKKPPIEKKKPPIKEKKPPLKKEKPPLKEPEKALPAKKEKPTLKKEKPLPEKEEKIIPSTTITIPPDLSTIAAVKTSQIRPLMPTHELLPLFEHVVGTILAINKQGISKTHIILNNPKFEATRFFGMEIVLTKYSSAPDSFNILFTGSNEEAISIVNDNLEGLYKVFQAADLPFDIGRISAEYKPLFKRKEAISEKDTGKETLR
jgi:hypothetical protein